MASLVGVEMDANVPEAGDGFELLPEGQYKMVIIGDELKTTKANTGKYLAVKLQVTDGAYSGKTVTDNINLINPSQVCQQIGQGTLKKICNICGIQYPPQDTTGMYGKPMTLKVGVQSFTSNTSGNELKSNTVKSYSKAVVTAPPVFTSNHGDDAPW